MKIRLTERAAKANPAGGRTIGTLWEPTHEGLGLSKEELDRVYSKLEQPPPKDIFGRQYRAGRERRHGLLVVYLVDPTSLKSSLASGMYQRLE
jgi:hypothetical protein